jgi:hypothetical protein
MRNRPAACVSAILAGILLIGWVLYEEQIIYNPTHQGAIDVKSAVIEPVTIEQCVVSVFALKGNQQRYGKGVVVEYDGETFVLTSNMILVDGWDSIDVIMNDWTARDFSVQVDEGYGLAAFSTEPGFFQGYPISDAPNLPPNTETVAINNENNVLVTVLDYINDDWFLITGVTENYIGAPLVNGGEITGIVVGINSINSNQAIAVGNRAIKEFVRDVVDAPPLPIFVEE